MIPGEESSHQAPLAATYGVPAELLKKMLLKMTPARAPAHSGYRFGKGAKLHHHPAIIVCMPGRRLMLYHSVLGLAVVGLSLSTRF